MPNSNLKEEALRVRRLYKFKTTDGSVYENNVALDYRDEIIEDLSDKDIKCEDLGMRKGQIWRRRNELVYSPKIIRNNPNLGEWGYKIVTHFDEDNWVYCKPFDIEKREIEDAYMSQEMQRQSSFTKRGYELFEGDLFKEMVNK